MEELEISLAGTCQIHNAALAVDAAMALKSMGYKIAEEHVRSGLRNTVWEGRFQILREAPTVIMDGAHNPNAAEVLMDAVDQYFPKNKIYYIFGVFSDKEYDKIIRITAGRAENTGRYSYKCNDAGPGRSRAEGRDIGFWIIVVSV